MKISFIILFCDKDFKYLKDIVNQIKEKANVDYEILLTDNRTENKDKINLDDEHIKIFNFGENTYNYGRIRTVNEATGDYIWFVDVDDVIVKFPDNINDFTKDLYEFCWCFEDGKKEPPRSDWPAVWNKIVKTSIMKKIVTILNTEAKISFLDDNFFCFLIENFSTSKEFVDEIVYKYMESRSRCNDNTKKIYGEKDCNRLLIGLETKDYLKELSKLKDYNGYEKFEDNVFNQLVNFCLYFVQKDLMVKYIKKLYANFPQKKENLYKRLLNSNFSTSDMLKVFSTERTKLS